MLIKVADIFRNMPTCLLDSRIIPELPLRTLFFHRHLVIASRSPGLTVRNSSGSFLANEGDCTFLISGCRIG